MLIANPIYDAVFKYLLEDKEIARKFLSAILEEEIVELEIRPQEQMVYSDYFLIRIMRLDFKAVIKTEQNAFKTILIELQKGKELIDIMRFRRYLGENYQKQEKSVDSEGNPIEEPLPIITIYFLGFKLANVPVPIVKVNRIYTDVTTHEPLQVKDEFIEKLTHDCFVIQIPRLKTKYQSRIEKVLSVFNQKFVMNTNNRFLDFPAEMDDELVEQMTKRLSKATGNEEIRKQLDAEEDLEKVIEKKLREKDILIEERDKMIEEERQKAEIQAKKIEELLKEIEKLKNK